MNGQITGVASNRSSAVIPKDGEQVSGGDAVTGTAGFPEFPSKPANEPAPIVQTSPAFKPLNSQTFPQATGTGTGTGAGEGTPAQSYQPPFTNGTESVGLSYPVATGTYQPSTVSDIQPPIIEQPRITGPADSQAPPQPPFSIIPGSGEAAPKATTIPPIVPHTPSGNPSESQHSSFQDTGPNTDTQNGDQGAGSTQAAPSLSSVIPYSSGSAVPISNITSQPGVKKVSPVPSAALPYGIMNSASIGTAGTTMPSTRTHPTDPTTFIVPPISPDSSIKPPFVNATAPRPSVPTSGTGAPYQPTTSTAPPSTFSPAPFRTTLYPAVSDSATTLAVNNSVPAGSSTSISQMPPSLPPVYATVTQEVIPMPLATAGSSNSTKLHGNFYGKAANRTTAQGTKKPGSSMGGPDPPNKDGGTTSVPATMTNSPELSLPVPNPTTTSPSTMTPTRQSSIPVISSPLPPSKPAPTSSSAPPPQPPPPENTATIDPTKPSCTPSNNPITADFNTFKLTKPPLPTPYLSLNYTGFVLSNGSPTPHLTSPASSPLKSISIAPGSSFNLSSIALACAAPPCNITMWGQSVPGAARALLTKTVLVEATSEGAQPYTVVERLAETGWVRLESVSFRVGEEGGGEMAVDNVVYTVGGGGGGCG
ncbi:MAG: hypothetical protein Q9208_008183 [Pyrenodesmia sp. 3 TL-2023]